MSWYCVEITEACVLGGDYHRLCRQFQRAFIQAGAPADMALFAQTAPEGDTRKVYFSPASIGFVRPEIESYGGFPCECPEERMVTLVFGVLDAKARLLAPLGGDGASSRESIGALVARRNWTPALGAVSGS